METFMKHLVTQMNLMGENVYIAYVETSKQFQDCLQPSIVDVIDELNLTKDKHLL